MAKTYKDIQSLTGLSLSTISKYFNGGSLRADNKDAIERAIKKLNYRVNPFAQGLKSNRSRKVGVLIPEFTSSFHTTIMSEVCHILRMAGYDTVVSDCHLDKRIERESLSFFLDKMVDGIITIPLNRDGSHLQAAADLGVPVVLVDRLTERFKTDAVIVDNRGAGQMAARELIDFGHERIGLISGLRDIYTMRERSAGFLEALFSAGIQKDERFIREIEFTVDGGYQAAMELLTQRERPTALFCANYDLTLGMIMAVNELGLRIGKDLSVVGFDNLMLAGIIKPSMTMIVQPMREIAAQASKLMIERLENASPGTRVIELPTQIFRGESIVKL